MDNVWWSPRFCGEKIQIDVLNSNKGDVVIKNIILFFKYLINMILCLFLFSKTPNFLVFVRITTYGFKYALHYNGWPRLFKMRCEFLKVFGPLTMTTLNHKFYFLAVTCHVCKMALQKWHRQFFETRKACQYYKLEVGKQHNISQLLSCVMWD